MGTIVQIDPDHVTLAAITEISREVVRGGVILYPTETMYGLGCDATNESSVRRLFAIKLRPETRPMLVLIGNTTMLNKLTGKVPQLASSLMKHYWPGPLTILLEVGKDVPQALTSGTGRIGVRMPGSTFCMKLLEVSGRPIVSTSANISGRAIPSDVASMKDAFLDKVDLFVDAGSLRRSLPSTIIDVNGTSLTLIREGAIPWEDIQNFTETTARSRQV
jgi:L-threonylcarbamoyladenylate synthase